MDQISDSNDGFANGNLFANSQQYNSYDNLSFLQNGSDSAFTDAGWGVNASDYPGNPAVSRGQQPAPGWQNAHHLSAPSTQAAFNGQSSPYGRGLNHSPHPYSPGPYVNYGNPPAHFAYQQQNRAAAQSPVQQLPQHPQHQQASQHHHQHSPPQQQHHHQQAQQSQQPPPQQQQSQPQPQQPQIQQQQQQQHQQQHHQHQQQQQQSQTQLPQQPQRSQYDQTLVGPAAATGQNFNIGLGGFNSNPPNNRTIAPQALEHDRQQPKFASPAVNNAPFATANNFQHARQNSFPALTTRMPIADQHVLQSSVPRGSDAGLFYIVNYDDLAKGANSERMGSFLNIGKQVLEWNVTRSAIPSYTARKSRNDLRRVAGTNPTLLAKIGKKSIKPKSLLSGSTPTKVRPIATSSSTDGGIKYEQDSSSEEDSSDDDSSYSEDSDYDSPLPSKRPDTLKGSVEYDTIKALWRSKRKAVDGETIRKALVDFWEIVKIIRDRWKVDTAAVSEAEEKKRTGELPLLRSRVKDQRDMLEGAFKAALKHGHRAIVELLSENVSLLFVCYQFLLDRFKDDDVNGGVSRAILETMSTFTTLTESKLEKTHIVKVLPRYQKKGDAKTQYWLKRIQTNVEIATREAAGKNPSGQNETKKASTLSSDTTKPSSPATKRPAPEPVTGTKRAATATAEGSATKKIATGTAKPANSTAGIRPITAVKKPSTMADRTAKPGGVAVNPATVKKTVVAKPSGFFSNLHSAAKKPGTAIAEKPSVSAVGRPAPGKGTTNVSTVAPKPAFSFAETMATLGKPKEERTVVKTEKVAPAETPEQRAKRLRKEERRKLRVVFKSGEDLVQIRYFVHDPSEEINHTSSQMRDVADVGGEGRMFKQQQHMMDMDDEDEIAEEMERLIDFKPPTNIDFSVVDPEERKRNYSRYGGGELEVESLERAIRENHENDTLMVIYTDPSEIPANPREPAEPYNGPDLGERKDFGDPADKEKYTMRVNAKRPVLPKYTAPQPYAPTGLNQFNYMQQQPYGNTATNSQAAPSAGPDINAILAALRQSTPAQPPPPPAPTQHVPTLQQPTYAPAYTNLTPVPEPQPQASSAVNDLAQIDLKAILASLQGNSATSSGPAPQSVASQAPSIMGLIPQLTQQQQQQQPPASSSSSAFASPGEGDPEDEEDLARIRTKNPFYKTKVCRFWQEGRCQKGSNCSYLHE